MKYLHLFLGIALSSVAAMAHAASPAKSGAWYLDQTMLSLDRTSRFVGSVAAVNPSDTPIYVRANVTRVVLKEGQRIRQADDQGVITLSPVEFVLRPKESFRVRILANANKLNNLNASYYVKFEDVSQILVNAGRQSGLAGGYLLAYETLVNVNAEAIDALDASHFSVTNGSGGKIGLTNLSKQHIYLERGNACPEAGTMLVDCDTIADFPMQSMLPGETLFFNGVAKPYLVILAQPKLNARTRANRIALPLPR